MTDTSLTLAEQESRRRRRQTRRALLAPALIIILAIAGFLYRPTRNWIATRGAGRPRGSR